MYAAQRSYLSQHLYLKKTHFFLTCLVKSSNTADKGFSGLCRVKMQGPLLLLLLLLLLSPLCIWFDSSNDPTMPALMTVRLHNQNNDAVA